MPYTPNTPWVDGSGGGTPITAARLNNMELGLYPVYAAYTPTWTSSGTPPAIGNAVVVARYAQVGKIVHAYGQITFGATSTFGTGAYSFALPVSAVTGTQSAGSAWARDVSVPIAAQPSPWISGALTMGLQTALTYLGTPADVGAAAPWTWAVSDILAWNITYEAA